MDDDMAWGSSVWDASDEASTSTMSGQVKPKIPVDDFDDFNVPMSSTSANDDDFGDFGDFDDGINNGFQNTFDTIQAFGDDLDGFGAMDNNWRSLRLHPLPEGSKLREHVGDILRPIWRHVDPSDFTTDEDIRQMGTLSQTLVTRESAELYATLFQQALPTIELPGWTRSRIRRQYLVSLGIPVNLDEVLPRANIKALPPLEINIRPSSAPPGHRSASRSVPNVVSSSRANSRTRRQPIDRPDAPNGSAAAVEAALGRKPELDEDKINRLLSLAPDTLRLLPLSSLQTHLASLQSLTGDASALLAYLLQSRDISQQDSETYNGLIAELVGEAQKWKAPTKSRTSLSRRSTLRDGK